MEETIAKTIVSLDGRILFYEINHFINDIVNGACCFICGAKPGSKEFNDEHIIPNWILKRYKLHDEKITLPNQNKIKYSRYTVPCCKECNSELGKHLEEPVNELLKKPYEEIANELKVSREKCDLLFRWLCLIYFKTHLKDMSLRENQDLRKEDKKIGDMHWWEKFHHIHCIVRSHHTGAQIDSKVYGSVYINKIIPNDIEERIDRFDYIDNSFTRGVLLQLGDFCVSSILDDSSAALAIFTSRFPEINTGISIHQFYEVFSHLNYIAIHLKEHPIFHSSISHKIGYNIIATRPEKLELIEKEKRIGTHGDFLKVYVERSIRNIPNRDTLLKEIEQGRRTFLWDENGNFNTIVK